MTASPDMQDTLWRRTQRDRFDGSGSLPDSARVAVIGGGFTGMTAARALARQGVETVVLEAGRLGEGASGQNAGFVVPNFALGAPDVVLEKLGEEKGGQLLDLVAGGADRVFTIAAEEQILCDAAQTGWLNPCTTDAEADMLRKRAGYWRSRGRPVRFLDREEIRAQTGMDVYRGALLDESGGTIHPLDYLTGLARAVEKAGGAVLENSPVQKIASEGGGYTITLAGGERLAAASVLLCTNAFTGGAAAKLGKTTVPLRVYQVATEPLDAETVARIAPDRRPVGDTRKNLFTYRLDRDNRLISGGMAAIPMGAKARLSRVITERLAEELSLPEVPNAEVAWTGVAALTTDFLPRIVRFGPNYFGGIGCNGRGIAMTAQLGETLARAALGADAEGLPIPLRSARRIPFHAATPLAASAGLIKARLTDRLSSLTRT
ncbi:FAD-dependent oxidoreductase [Roseicyclus sp. F158]|uniref:FAD-dependent oxidoreductase n=1 Tax=Tropicimonas omnivorans TaxID=3075590 RepID=A0ABU3DD27_9RHOB|nr:FAD-dependent oxidoreductase [Roseicyclus sp. F158]MDT0681623.1 FAD-dependent oxidoreductase [Roseicyclus sp. F158]